MHFIEPEKYEKLMDKILDGEDVDKDELEAAMKEYEEALEQAVRMSNALEQRESNMEKSMNASIALIVSKAKSAEKKKLAPLGVPKKETEGGQE